MLEIIIDSNYLCRLFGILFMCS